MTEPAGLSECFSSGYLFAEIMYRHGVMQHDEFATFINASTSEVSDNSGHAFCNPPVLLCYHPVNVEHISISCAFGQPIHCAFSTCSFVLASFHIRLMLLYYRNAHARNRPSCETSSNLLPTFAFSIFPFRRAQRMMSSPGNQRLHRPLCTSLFSERSTWFFSSVQLSMFNPFGLPLH